MNIYINFQAKTIDPNLTWIQAIKLNVNNQGIISLWKGVVPTLWRDVPFSGIYWMGYETFKDIFTTNSDTKDNKALLYRWQLSFKSGALSGVFATLFTQPFDVIKTRRQSQSIGNNTINQDIIKPLKIYYSSNVYNNNNIANPTTNSNNKPPSTNNIRSPINSNNNGLFSIGKSIIKREGLSGLFTGIGPRMTRVPLSCAIMVSSYELGKLFLSSNQS